MKKVILTCAVITIIGNGVAYACPLSSHPSECYAVDCSTKPNWFEKAMCKIGILGQSAPHG